MHLLLFMCTLDLDLSLPSLPVTLHAMKVSLMVFDVSLKLPLLEHLFLLFGTQLGNPMSFFL